MPVTTTTTPAAATSTTAASTAPASVAVDFMAILGLAGTSAPAPAATVLQAMPEAPALTDGEELEKTDTESVDLPGMLPLSLPVMPAEAHASAAGTQASALLDVATGAAKAHAVAPEAQLLSELIQPEQVAGQGKFEIPQLPTSDESASPLRQAEPTHSRPVHVPVGDARWADEIGSRMTMMVEQGKHTASLRLSPEHLGPLEVRITMNGDQASVQFGAAHVDTRNALENALPRLREMFASQGLTLTDANVSREPPREQSNHMLPSGTASSSLGSEEEAVSSIAPAQVHLGLLDTYA